MKQALLEGIYDEGELLSEGAIAAELGVSRTPVREACLQLEGEGLLRLYPKRGALVVGLSAREIAELFDLRQLLEGPCLERVDGPALAAELDEHLQEQHAALATGDAVRFAASDRALHRAWVAAAGNSLLLQLYDRLRDRQHRMAVRVAKANPQNAPTLLAEHANIVDALRVSDPAAAAEALSTHLSRAAGRTERA